MAMLNSNNDDRILPLAATALVCSLGTAYWWTRKRSIIKMTKDPNDDDDEVAIELLAVEQSLAAGAGGDYNAISTLTWFQGDYRRAFNALRERAEALVKLNPWLTGRVQKRNGKYALVYRAKIQPKEIIQEHVFCHADEKLLSRDVPLDQLGPTCANLFVKTGPTEPLWKLHVIPCHKEPTERFAVMFTLAHGVADGHTFYRIHNMLLNHSDDDVPLEALNATRILTTEQAQIQALGGEAEYKILQSAGFIVNCILGVLHALFTKTKHVGAIHLVDKEGMEATKKKLVANDDSVQFVSTNDVLTSWFLQNSHCKHGMMALNFRGRLAGHTEAHAGNYENVIFYRPSDSATPALIRQSITTQKLLFQRRVTHQQAMPSFWTMAGGSIAVATNWASFAKPCQLEGCTEDIHMPLYNLEKGLPSTMAIFVIFRAGPRGLGVYFAGPPDKVADLQKKVPFLHAEQLQ